MAVPSHRKAHPRARAHDGFETAMPFIPCDRASCCYMWRHIRFLSYVPRCC